ncbi:MAG: AraC family transcriptional regulator [Chloroflexota bacterium]|nr:MAG: AraC family transcriptional regulator [Chloroflexota bacterium]
MTKKRCGRRKERRVKVGGIVAGEGGKRKVGGRKAEGESGKRKAERGRRKRKVERES